MRLPVSSAKMIHQHEEIVIGSNLRAVLYAFHHKLPIFFSRLQRPFRFDHLAIEADLTPLGLTNEARMLQTHANNIKIGQPAEVLWERLLLLLSLSGRAPLNGLCETLRYNGSTLVCSNEYSKIAEIKFDKAYYFGDDNCSGLVTQKRVANPVYMCYDWIAFNRGGKHNIDLIETQDNFVKQIWFYPSDRIDGNTHVKDACVVSILTEEELLSFDYSQTMAKFKMLAEMEGRGMKGLFNGCSPTGTPKYYKFRTTIIGRERRVQLPSPQPSVETVTIPKTKEEDLLKALPQACVGYHRLLENI
jgi:hypothetical protein